LLFLIEIEVTSKYYLLSNDLISLSFQPEKNQDQNEQKA